MFAASDLVGIDPGKEGYCAVTVENSVERCSGKQNDLHITNVQAVVFVSFIWWVDTDSNRGPKDYEFWRLHTVQHGEV